MSEFGIAHRGTTGGEARTGFRLTALVAVLSILAMACGGESATSESSSAREIATGNSTNEAESETAGADKEAQSAEDDTDSLSANDDKDSGSTSDSTDATGEVVVGVAMVDLPPEIELFPGGNQNATLGQVSYVVTGQADGMRLIAVSLDGATTTDALIVEARSAQVFNSGTRIVMTGSNAAGELILLSSEDGVSFVEARIPPPKRFVDADVWQATSVVGSVLGVADLNGELFMIASQGIDWPRDVRLVAQFAYSVSDELGDAVAAAGVIRQVPQGDDVLYTFVVNDEVIFEVLGSEAGLEPGYRQAVAAATDTETRIVGGWMVSGSTASPTSDPPLGGGLQEEMRLNALYPANDGVVAVVTDWDAQGPASLRAPVAGDSSATSRPTGVAINTYLSNDGIDWKQIGTLFGPTRGGVPGVDTVGDPGLDPDDISTLFSEGTLTLFSSDGNVIWEGPDWSQDFPDLPAGAPLDVLAAFGGYLIVQPPLEPGGEFRVFDVAQADDGSTKAVEKEVELIDPLRFDTYSGEDATEPFAPILVLVLWAGGSLNLETGHVKSYAQFLNQGGG